MTRAHNLQAISIDTDVDGHIHTSMCMHAVGSMEEYVLSAIDKGIRKIFFLEHLEEGINYFQRTWLNEQDFDYYFEEGIRLKKRYEDHIEIGLGVEVGFNPEKTDLIRERLKKRNWERIGISYHYHRLPGQKQHLNLLSSQQHNIEICSHYGIDHLLSSYFDALITAVQLLPGTVLCHLDAGLRHCPGIRLKEQHLEQIQQLLHLVKENNMALEINTSGIPLRNTPFPAPEIIRQAFSMEIPLVAGSDAHHPKDVARSFNRLPELLEAI